MNKVIFTADDYGVLPSVNRAIIDLVNRKLINGIEVFTNYEHSITNIEKLFNETLNDNFELGAHLTITSGSPLTNHSGLAPLIHDGCFLPFSKINSNASAAGIYKEIKSQVECLMDIPEYQKKLTHITCHHDALWFFPEYTKQLIRVSNELNLPVRNPKSYPPKRDKFYYSIVVPLLKTLSFTRSDVKLLKSTFKLRKNGKFPGQDLVYRAPDYMDSRHYGPIPQNGIQPYKKVKMILKKQKKLHKMLSKAMVAGGKDQDKLIEFMFHVRKGNVGNGVEGFKAEMDACDYPGIDSKYFDSRVIEFESLRFYEDALAQLIGKSFELGSWRDATTQTLEKA